MNLMFFSIVLIIPFIVLAAVKFPNSRWLGLSKINNAWHAVDQAGEQIIKPYQSYYTLKQYMVLWIMTSTAAYVVTWFVIILSWIGVFSDGLLWTSSNAITDLIQLHIELSFLAFIVMLTGRFHGIPTTYTFKRRLLKQWTKQKTKDFLYYFYLKTVVIGFLFNWLLLHLYILIIEQSILLSGIHNVIIWNWFE